MASTYDQIKKGNLKYTPAIKQLLKEMITVSDNEACNQLVRYNSRSGSFTDGARTINKYLSANQYTETECHHTLHPASSSYIGDGRSNVSSARDCGVLLEHIYDGTCVSSKYSKEMLNLLLRQTRRWKIPAGLPSGIKVANKTGESSSASMIWQSCMERKQIMCSVFFQEPEMRNMRFHVSETYQERYINI